MFIRSMLLQDKTLICTIDGKNIKTMFGESVLQACFKAYIDIPRFCYHDGLRIAGNCRMCLVEVGNSRKLIASCATPIVGSFNVFTKTFRVKRARQAILEFLLINHPLDCPICDQGGECDLQDITLVFGRDRGRFYEIEKRSVYDKVFGPLIKTIMNRCIHCTRCVRYFKEILFVDDNLEKLGVMGRGSNMEIGSYLDLCLLHELSGNVIDLCPVGALTSKPFAFKARSWELTSLFTYDIIDCFMPRVKFDLIGSNILRILPTMGASGAGWISNRTRFCFDMLNLQRYDSCLWNFKEIFNDNFLTCKLHSVSLFIQITWKDAFALFLLYFLRSMKQDVINYLGNTLSLDNVWSIKVFFAQLGLYNFIPENFISFLSSSSKRQANKLQTNIDFRSSYVIDIPLNLLEINLWVIFLIGVNLRMEAPLLFVQIKKMYNTGFVSMFCSISSFLSTKAFHKQVGVTTENLLKLFEGRLRGFRDFFKKILFYKVIAFINLELSFTFFADFLQRLFLNFFNYIFSVSKFSFYFSTFLNTDKKIWFCTLQRYVGYISQAELGLLQTSFLSTAFKKSKGLHFFFDTSLNTLSQKCAFDFEAINIALNSIIPSHAMLPEGLNLICFFKSNYEASNVFFDFFFVKKQNIAVLPVKSKKHILYDVFKAFSIFLKQSLNFVHTFSIYVYITCFSSINFSRNFTILFDALIANKNSSNTFQTFAFFDCFFFYESYNYLLNYNFISCFSFFSKKFSKEGSFCASLPFLNFYKDDFIDQISFSKTMLRSSTEIERSKKMWSFSVVGSSL